MTSPIAIITCAYNRPDFIEMQHKTFQHFLKEPYTFIVFNDASDNFMRNRIEAICKRLSIKCVSIPTNVHQEVYPVRFKGEPLHHEIRCAQAIQYALDVQAKKSSDLTVLIDSDVFLVKPFSFEEYANGYDCAGVIQTKKTLRYIKNGIAIFDFSRISYSPELNFFPARIENIPLGIGGHMYYFFKNNKNISCKDINEFRIAQMPLCDRVGCMKSSGLCCHEVSHLKQEGFNDEQVYFLSKNPQNVSFFCNQSFLHYGGGTNWNARSQEYVSRKTKIVEDYITNIMRD